LLVEFFETGATINSELCVDINPYPANVENRVSS